MPLRFDTDTAYEHWRAEHEKREFKGHTRPLTDDASSSSIPPRKRDKSRKPGRVRHHAGRPVRHLLRGGVKGRGKTVLRTLLGPLR